MFKHIILTGILLAALTGGAIHAQEHAHVNYAPGRAELAEQTFKELVKTVGGMVHAIFLPSGGARLDGSGLGADSAPEEFMAAYGLDEPLGNKNREIGTCGEKLKLLNIRPKTLLLSFSDT